MRHVRKFLLAWAISALVASARDAEADRRAVIAVEDEWLHAEHDRAVLERILAEDFAHPVPQGLFLTKRQHIDWAVLHPAQKGRKLSFEKLDVRVYGDAAIATGIVNDRAADGSDLRRTIFTDIFAYRSGHWQAVNAQENVIPAGAR